MQSVISIHQPNYIPWMGYFYKIYCSDIFVYLDKAQFSKGSVGNRNKIKTIQGTDLLLSVPLKKENGSFHSYNQTFIEYKNNWNEKHLNLINQSYKGAPFFKDYFEDIEKILLTTYENLTSLNVAFINYVVQKLGITTKMHFESDITGELGLRNERLINICLHFNATTYLSGNGAKAYNDENLYTQHGMKLVYTSFKHPVYSQINGPFVPNLSILDAMFNCSPEQIISFFETLKKNQPL